jgi:type IV pilus assembly protein PilQ
MISKLTRTGKNILPIFLLAVIVYLLVGCNANNMSNENRLPPKSITEILVNEEVKSWNCIIKGNIALTFSAINQITPTGILLYFPDTTLAIPATDFIVPANELISSIEANEFTNGNFKNSRIFIGLNKDRPYSISPDENGLKISFPKSLAAPPQTAAILKSPEMDAVEAGDHDIPSVNLLKAVIATPLENNIIVNVNADAAITDYQSFAIENPARIVFDIYNLKSPHQEDRTIAVDSKLVKRIRYNTYPDKIRLVLDTEKQFLTEYLSFPTASGLLIYVGRIPESSGKK